MVGGIKDSACRVKIDEAMSRSFDTLPEFEVVEVCNEVRCSSFVLGRAYPLG